VDYVAFADWIFFGLTAAGLFVYRSRDRASPSLVGELRFRTPGYPWTPAVFVLMSLFVVLSSVAANPRNAAIGGALLALGIPVYWFWSRRGTPRVSP
jgi:APA family basic amino acid/polyamine antiporter